MNKHIEEYKAFKRGEIRMPSHLKPKKEEQGRLYKSKIIEMLARSPFWVPHVMWVVMFSSFLLWAFLKTELTISEIFISFLGGFITWTFVEYIMHRFLYHTEIDSEGVLKFQMDMHGNHHHYPKDPERLAMPPVPGFLLAVFFFGLFYSIMGIYAVAFFPGFIFSYDVYIVIHYYQHRVKSPNYKPWKKLWQHHKAHHYSNPYAAFGVSTRLWDYVFGTMPKQANEKKKINVNA